MMMIKQRTRRISLRGLDLRVELERGVWILECDGCLDALTVEPVRELADELSLSGARLCFDLRRATRISTAGAGMLLTAHNRARVAGGGAVLIPPRGPGLEVLEDLGLLSVLLCAPDPDAACRVLGAA